MAKWVPLTKRAHGQKSWNRREDYTFAARQALVPLDASELGRAACEMLIGFVKEAQAYQLEAILSHRRADNLYVGPDGKWLLNYVPMDLRSFPFRLMRPPGRERTVLCIDEASSRIIDGPGGEPFFDAEGQPSKVVEGVLERLKRHERNRAATGAAIAALADAGVIVPWVIKVKEGPDKSVGGLYRIDEAALNRIDDDTFLKLRKVRALWIAYCQIISLQHSAKLRHLAETQKRLRSKADEHKQVLREMFTSDDGNIPL